MNRNAYDFAEHARRKEASRQDDARALKEGRVSLDQLRAVNEPFRPIVAAGVRVNLRAAQSLH